MKEMEARKGESSQNKDTERETGEDNTNDASSVSRMDKRARTTLEDKEEIDSENEKMNESDDDDGDNDNDADYNPSEDDSSDSTISNEMEVQSLSPAAINPKQHSDKNSSQTEGDNDDKSDKQTKGKKKKRTKKRVTKKKTIKKKGKVTKSQNIKGNSLRDVEGKVILKTRAEILQMTEGEQFKEFRVVLFLPGHERVFGLENQTFEEGYVKCSYLKWDSTVLKKIEKKRKDSVKLSGDSEYLAAEPPKSVRRKN